MVKTKKNRYASSGKRSLALLLLLLGLNSPSFSAPKSDPIWYQLYKSGIAKYKAKLYRKALNDLLRAISYRKDLHVAHKYIGFIYLQLHKNSLAEIHLKRSLALKKNQSQALYRLGKLYYNTYSLNKAKRTFRKALKYTPADTAQRSEILYLLLRISVIEKDSQDQKRLQQKIYDVDNGRSEDLRQKAQKHLQQGHTQKAHQKLKKATQINPINIQALMELANLYRKTKHGPKAIKLYQRILLLHPDHEMAHTKLAHIYYEKHRWQKSLQHFRKLVRINPRNSEAWIRYINMLRVLNKPNQRQKAVQRARSYGIELPF
jgi:tetratricopeptide (TPR) repeat protein